MLNKSAMKLLKLLTKYKFITADDIEKKYHIDLITADYLVRLGFAKYERIEYTPLSITQEGLSFLSQCKYDSLKFIIPTVISVVALILSVIAIILKVN